MFNTSKNNEYPIIADLFCLLDRWRHLPNYQLERRADVFFALFLPEVLEAHLLERNCSVEINRTLIPEFPIKKKNDNRSKKADYLALSKDGKRAFLIELKTDIASRRKKQDDYLKQAAERGLCCLVKDVLKICRATGEKAKYVHFLKLLSDIDLIEYEDGLFPIRKGYSEVLKIIKDKVKKRSDWPSLEVVYIQPRLTTTIDFKEFADTIEKGEGGGIRSLFACYLREWAANDAGSTDPKDWPSC